VHRFFDKKNNKDVVIISPGEYFATSEDIIIQTLLGSCISVCLYSDFDRLAAMNHFMLPRYVEVDKITSSESGRYGMYAMELIIGEFVKRGIKKGNLKAKVFGGSNVIDFDRQHDSVASNNIKFAVNFLDREKIPMISCHLGGSSARKILFLARSRKVLLKEIGDREKQSTIREELEYQKEIQVETKKSSVTFF